ncbi:MAG: hypothetical protein ACREQ4_05925 [Candidatus Binataceae bacterium]
MLSQIMPAMRSRVADEDHADRAKISRLTLVTHATIVILIIAALSACAPSASERAHQLEPMLSAAGFRMYPADTPARMDELKSLTPLKMRYYPYKGKLHYWFADPKVCHCIYIGNAEDYQEFEKLKLEQERVKNEERAAEMNQEAAQQEQMNFMMWPMGPFF